MNKSATIETYRGSTMTTEVNTLHINPLEFVWFHHSMSMFLYEQNFIYIMWRHAVERSIGKLICGLNVLTLIWFKVSYLQELSGHVDVAHLSFQPHWLFCNVEALPYYAWLDFQPCLDLDSSYFQFNRLVVGLQACGAFTSRLRVSVTVRERRR